MKSTKKISMADVAKKIGVSRATVSYVLNDIPNANISQETRIRIWEAVEELGYKSNAIARSLRSGKSDLIGFLTDNISDTPFIVDIIRGVQDAAIERNKTMFVMDAKNERETEEKLFHRMEQWQVEGIIYAVSTHREIILTDDFFVTPLVLVDCYSKSREISAVVPNEVQGGYTATYTLLEKGHTRIGFINGPEGFPASIGRLEGYRKALDEYGISFDPSLIRVGDWWQESGFDATLDLLSMNNAPTAIFCGNDYMAMGAYDALKKLGKTIPDQVAIIGFDNREIIAAHMHPPLTTVALPYYQMGKRALEQLLAEKNEKKCFIELDCPLIMRKSV
ncbi:MAG: LacI family DNA-binding transcriptional regulator [Flexilinea sp.]